MTDLLHGDCLEKMKDIPDKSIDMILCDLPYGTTHCKWDVAIPFEPLWKEYKRIIKDRGCIALFGSEPFSSYLRMSNIKQYKYDWIWNKKQSGSFQNAKYNPLKITETISIFNSSVYYPQMRKGKMRKKGGAKSPHYTAHNMFTTPEKICDDYFPINIIEIAQPRLNNVHPTQKPVVLLEYLIKTYTLENETVLDNTMGSGSTGVACINTNRKFIGIEKDDKYFEIAKNRIKKAQQDVAPKV